MPQEEAPFPLNDTDKFVLSLTDEEYAYHTWDDLKRITETNDLAALKRKPSDLRRYIKWTAQTKADYGSTTEYLLAHRLPKTWGRPPFTPVSDVPFAEPSDYRVLMNDWPYGFVPGITHIVVWSRTPIPTDPEIGDMTAESRQTVADFVRQYFVDAIGPGGEDKVLWFKNWTALQSVRALDHIHVLVRDVEPSLLQEWTTEREWHRSQ
ncbi:N-acetylglucosamine-induced protein 1 [Naviculisporaceae sp. PSN 640]